MTPSETGLAILALVPLGWAAAFLLIYREPRRKRVTHEDDQTG